MFSRQPIRDAYNKILGYVEEDASGVKTYRDFSLRIVAKYYPQLNVTKDFYGKLLSTSGDVGSSQLFKR